MKLPRSFDLRSLSVFTAVKEAGSMTAAADRLGMTQSAVSQAIHAMEDGLGVTLVDRTVRPLALTPSGRILYDRASNILAEADSAVDLVRNAADTLPPFLSIAMIDSFVSVVGPHIFPAFGRIAQHCRVWSGLSPMLIDHFASRRVDIIITTGETLPDSLAATSYDLLIEPYLLALPRRYDGPLDDLAALARDFDIIRFSERSNIGRDIEQHLRRLRLQPPHRMEFDFSDSVLSMVGNGAGWAIATPLCCLQSAPYLQDVRLAPLPGPGLNRRVTLQVRDPQFAEAARMIAEECRHVLNEVLVPKFLAEAPWCGDMITVGPT